MKRLTVKNLAVATLCATMAFGAASTMANRSENSINNKITVKFANNDWSTSLPEDYSLQTYDFSNAEAWKGSIPESVLSSNLPTNDTVTYNDNGTVTTDDNGETHLVNEITLHTAGFKVGAILHDTVLNNGSHELSIDYYPVKQSGYNPLAGSLAGKDGTGLCSISTIGQPKIKMENETKYTIRNHDAATISCPFTYPYEL